jgi:hypothetical protein
VQSLKLRFQLLNFLAVHSLPYLEVRRRVLHSLRGRLLLRLDFLGDAGERVRQIRREALPRKRGGVVFQRVVGAALTIVLLSQVLWHWRLRLLLHYFDHLLGFGSELLGVVESLLNTAFFNED